MTNKPSLVKHLASNFKKELPNFEDFDINKKNSKGYNSLMFFLTHTKSYHLNANQWHYLLKNTEKNWANHKHEGVFNIIISKKQKNNYPIEEFVIQEILKNYDLIIPSKSTFNQSKIHFSHALLDSLNYFSDEEKKIILNRVVYEDSKNFMYFLDKSPKLSDIIKHLTLKSLEHFLEEVKQEKEITVGTFSFRSYQKFLSMPEIITVLERLKIEEKIQNSDNQLKSITHKI